MGRSRFMPEDFELTPEQREKIRAKYEIEDAEIDRQLEQIAEWEFKDPKSDWYRVTLRWIRVSDSRGDLRRHKKYTTTAHVETADSRQQDMAKFEEDMKRFKVVK